MLKHYTSLKGLVIFSYLVVWSWLSRWVPSALKWSWGLARCLAAKHLLQRNQLTLSLNEYFCYICTMEHRLLRSTLLWNVGILLTPPLFSTPPKLYAMVKSIHFFNILLYIDNWHFLPRSQYNFLFLMLSSAFFFFMWIFHHSLVSSVIPRYLAIFSFGIIVPLILTGKWFINFLIVKSINCYMKRNKYLNYAVYSHFHFENFQVPVSYQGCKGL